MWLARGCRCKVCISLWSEAEAKTHSQKKNEEKKRKRKDPVRIAWKELGILFAGEPPNRVSFFSVSRPFAGLTTRSEPVEGHRFHVPI